MCHCRGTSLRKSESLFSPLSFCFHFCSTVPSPFSCPCQLSQLLIFLPTEILFLCVCLLIVQKEIKPRSTSEENITLCSQMNSNCTCSSSPPCWTTAPPRNRAKTQWLIHIHSFRQKMTILRDWGDTDIFLCITWSTFHVNFFLDNRYTKFFSLQRTHCLCLSCLKSTLTPVLGYLLVYMHEVEKQLK